MQLAEKFTSKDGVEVGPQGIEFEVTTGPEDAREIKVITLREVLLGLNMKVNEGKTQSQAQSFASFAIQRGFTTEAEILERHREARAYVKDGEITSRSWSLISTWEQEVRAERNRKSRETMRSNDTEMSPGQIAEAMRLAPLLTEKGFNALAGDLMRIVQINEETEGPQGAVISYAIGRGQTLLNMNQPRQAGSSSSAQPEKGVASEKVSDEKVTANPEEPF